MKTDEQQIRDLIQTWTTATQQGDIQTVLDLMTDDVVFTVAGQEPFGKAEFESASKQQENINIEGTNNIVEIKVMGDWAYTRTYINLTITSDTGSKPVHRSGYTLSILCKESDGKWRITRDANLLTVDQ